MPPTVMNFLRKLFCLCYQQIAPTSRPMLISRRRPGWAHEHNKPYFSLSSRFSLDSVEGTNSSALLKGSIKNYLDPALHSIESFASTTLTNHPRHPLYELLIRWTPSPPSLPAPSPTSRPPLPSNPHRQRSRTCPNSTPSTMTEAPDPPDRALSHERRIYLSLPYLASMVCPPYCFVSLDRSSNYLQLGHCLIMASLAFNDHCIPPQSRISYPYPRRRRRSILLVRDPTYPDCFLYYCT